MMDRLFICGTDPEAGSSVVALGLYGVLARSVSKVGFFKPVGGGPDDQDVAVMKTAFGLAREPAELCPVTLDDARELMGGQRQEELLQQISRPWAQISRDGGFVLVEGINNQPSMNLFDMDINVAIAAHLRAPVLLVARGSQSGSQTDLDQLITTVMKTSREFAEQDIDVLGVVVNRVEDRPTEELNERLIEAFSQAEIPYFGLLPSLNYLAFPKLDQIARELNARILSEGSDLEVPATNVLVAAMEPRHFLKYIKSSGTLVIVPGDRENILLTLACLQTTPARGSMSGVVLTGGLEPDPEILSLIEDMHLPNLPVMLVETDTFTTANRIKNVSARIRPQDRDKINAALSDVAAHLAHERIREAFEMPRKPRRPMGSDVFLDELIDRARRTQKRVVLPEGEEPRTLLAAQRILDLEICPLTLLGNPDRIRHIAAEGNVRLNGNVDLIDPAQSPAIDEYTDTIVAIRKGKRGGITPEVARQWLLESPIHFGTLMVKHDHANGLVAGAIHATRDTIRPAFQIIRVSHEAGIASSVFFMALKDRVLVYGDCAIIPNPTAEELARIAVSSARTARAFGIQPRVALLSYSTGKSGTGESVDKVAEATVMVKEMNPDFAIDGPLQYDAAIDPDVGRLKQPDSPVAGQANVFIFPDLDAGNIAYKAVQRSAGAIAVGPVMQGLNKPVNDLSRGCSVDDIVYTVAVTAIQAGSS